MTKHSELIERLEERIRILISGGCTPLDSSDVAQAAQALREQDEEIERLCEALEQAQADLFKCRESRLAGTIRDLPEIKAAFDQIERLQERVRVLEAVRLSVCQMGEDLRYSASDWVVDPALAEEYIEPVYQQALAAAEGK